MSIRKSGRRDMKKGVLIIECLDKDDPGSEGRVLEEVFKLMQVESQRRRVASIEELLKVLVAGTFRHVHISTHGSLTAKNKFQGWWTPSNVGTRRMLEKIPIKLACTSIVSTACRSGATRFANLVTNKWGAKYYIAPARSPVFHNAALFAHIYYYKLFYTRRTVPCAFESYANNYKNPHGFTLHTRGGT